MKKALFQRLAVVTSAALIAAGNAHAAIDVSAATTGISDASTASLAVLAALTTMAIAIWGVRKVMRFFGGH